MNKEAIEAQAKQILDNFRRAHQIIKTKHPNRNLYKHYVLLRNMEIIGKISRGSKMDQIYIPKNRPGLPAGSHVIIKPLDYLKEVPEKHKLYFYNAKSIEPIKITIINELIKILDSTIKYDNIIITGSFLEKGFNFNDIDTLITTEEKINLGYLENIILNKLGIKAHTIILSNQELIMGLSTGPIYQLMLSKCISAKRLIYKTAHKFNYKFLDLHLLKSKTLIDNFDILSGEEKYYLTRNLIALSLFLKKQKISQISMEKEIKLVLNKTSREIKQNLLNKPVFLKKYKEIYQKTLSSILSHIVT